MISHLIGSDTAVFVLHEIYGLNQHILDFCKDMAQYGFDVYAPDLLGNGQVFNEEQEEAAYQYFMKQPGFEAAVRKVSASINGKRSAYRKIIIIAFSVGATTAWLCSREAGLCDGVVCFYGSRIRDYLELKPECPVLLFYPEKEKAFEVSEVVSILNEKEGVNARQLQGEHGFANPFSVHYNEQSAQAAEKETIGFIRGIIAK